MKRVVCSKKIGVGSVVFFGVVAVLFFLFVLVSVPVMGQGAGQQSQESYTFGDRSVVVQRVQQALNMTECPVALSGVGSKGQETTYFGPLTRQALVCYQAQNGLSSVTSVTAATALAILRSEMSRLTALMERLAVGESADTSAAVDCSNREQYQWSGDLSIYDILYACLPEGWNDFLTRDDVRDTVQGISEQIGTFYSTNAQDILFGPSPGVVFEAFYATEPSEMKAVILGLDPRIPYATGLSFQIAPTISTNEVGSIQRILLEARNQNICVDPLNGDTSRWAREEGVFLLNAALTFAYGHCHDSSEENAECMVSNGAIRQQDIWQPFMSKLFEYINDSVDYVVYIGWGAAAQELIRDNVDLKNNGFVYGPHPSPANFRRDQFFCGNYYSCVNEMLMENDRMPVNWDLTTGCQDVENACDWQWGRGRRVPDSTLRSTCASRDYCQEISCDRYK